MAPDAHCETDYLGPPPSAATALAALAEPVRRWFAQRFGEPTPAQRLAWPSLAAGKNLLLGAPTGSGKTLAAFLPTIFGKVSQCTKELRMGELNNLHFTVGNVPWKIFRVNAIFFAAFGRAGHPLPTAQLAALANELDRRKQ